MPKSKKGDIRSMIHELRTAVENDDTTRVNELSEAIEFGREPGPGKEFVRNLMSQKLVEQSQDTPYTCSVASETYWCS